MSDPYASGPSSASVTPPSSKPDNHLVNAFLATVFCCLPLGIVALAYAAQVDSKWNEGDLHGAQTSSAKAKMWCLISLACGILTAIVLLGLMARAGVASD